MEKRAYKRLKVDIEGVFVLAEKRAIYREFTGILEDISEGGIKIVVSSLAPLAPVDSINIGDTIHFSSIDDYIFHDIDEVSLIEGDVKVVRKEYINNEIILGGQFVDLTPELENYIKTKKRTSFLVSM